MATTVFDSVLFRDMFGTPQMRAVFDDRAYVARCIDAETGLARAQARAGLIPAEAAQQISARSQLDKIDLDAMRAETEIVGYPILPLVRQLSAMCGEAGRYVHWGATTQDIMDTATMLQCKQAVEIIEAQLDEVRAALKTLAADHASPKGRLVRKGLERAAQKIFRTRLKMPVDVYEGPAMNHSYHEMIIGHGKCFSTVLLSEAQEQLPAAGYRAGYHVAQFLATKLALEQRGRAVVALLLKDLGEKSLAALDEFFQQTLVAMRSR